SSTPPGWSTMSVLRPTTGSISTISGSTMRRLCLLAVFLLPSTPTFAAPALEALLAGLKREPPVSEPFQDVRYRRALKAPLVSAGTLAWHGGLEFERSVVSPYRETGRVYDRTLTVTRERGPERVIPL